MTHSILMVIKNRIEPNEFELVEELKENIYAYEDFLEVWGLEKKKNGDVHQKGGTQPFIRFPEKEDSEDEDFEGYEIIIETGSHVSVDDRDFALQWFYFTLAFKEAFKEDLGDFVCYYIESGDDKIINEEHMREMICD